MNVDSLKTAAPNAPRGPELRQEAQPRSNLTFISEDVLLKTAVQRFRKQLVTVRDLGQDRGTEGGGTRGGREGGVTERGRGRDRHGDRESHGYGETWGDIERHGETDRETKMEA